MARSIAESLVNMYNVVSKQRYISTIPMELKYGIALRF